MSVDFDSPTTDWLRARGTARWHDVEDGVIPLWVAEMDFPIAEPVQAAIEETVSRQAYGYPRDNGLKEAWARWAGEHQGLDVDPGRVEVLPDVLAGVRLALRTFSPAGSPVIIPSPAYMPFWEIPPMLGREAVPVPMVRGEVDGVERWTFDLDGIDRAFDQGARSMILCQPHNPLGRVHTRSELAALAEVVARHDGFVVADEIHGPLVVEGSSVPYATVSPQAAAHSVNVTSASKSWNLAGLKTALITFFDDDAAARWRREVHPLETEGATTVGMAANLAAYTEGQSWLDAAVGHIHDNAVWLAQKLARRAPQVRMEVPEGTYLAWLDLTDCALGTSPGPWLLRHARVRLNDGPTFGPGGEGHARLNLATPRPLLVEATERMVTALDAR